MPISLLSRVASSSSVVPRGGSIDIFLLSFIPVSFPFESVTGEGRKEKSLSGRQQPHVTSIPKHPAVAIV